MNKQYCEYFKDVLRCDIKRYLRTEDLYFVTFQPNGLILNLDEIKSQTKLLFGSANYVEIIEQTFKVSNRYNTANYIDGWHSHLIMSKKEFSLMKESLKGFDIVGKDVYDLNGLVNYLTKQFVRTKTMPFVNVTKAPNHD